MVIFVCDFLCDIDDDEIEELTAYVTSGGSFLLIGDDFGYDFGATWSSSTEYEFWDLFGVDYVVDYAYSTDLDVLLDPMTEGLTQLTGYFDGDVLVRNDAVSPLRPVGDRRPDEDDRRPGDKGLPLPGLPQALLRLVAKPPHPSQQVLQWEVPVDAGLKPLNPVHYKVGLEGVAGSPRGGGPPRRGEVPADALHPLRRPEEE